MTDVDLGRVIRLKTSIDQAAAAGRMGDQWSPMGGEAMKSAYLAMRQELLLLLDESNLVEEFQRMNPAVPDSRPPVLSNLFAASAYSESYGSALLRMAGWLDGLIQESRMRMEIAALTTARIKEERGTGFRGPQAPE